FITDLKIGYWLGSTPQKQETFKFLGILVSAATVGGVIMILNKIHGFTPDNADVMAAPQARAMAAVIEPLMSGQGAPWLLYGIGAVIALVLNACGISALAFALGMFIPLQLNLPLMVGGLASWYVNTRSTDATTNSLRNERGTLLASGFIAGGALMGVASTGLQFFGINLVQTAWLAQPAAEWLSLVMYVLLTVYLVRASISAKR
ncbi:MAG: OPT/YSL family transporter, partial [Alloprevotella sp.]